MRLRATIENLYKEREQRNAAVYRQGIETMVRAFRPVFDDLERALEHFPETAPLSFQKGLEAVRDAFVAALQKMGIARIACEGATYDPKFHESIGEEERKEGQEPFVIVHEATSGWMWEDGKEVIVPAKVKIVKE